MLKFLCLFAFIAGALATPVPVGPKQANRGDFPHQAYLHISVKNTDKFTTCGATVISNRFALATAACVSSIDDLANVKLVAGSIRLNTKFPDGTLHTVDKVRVHPKYQTFHASNDIAVLRVHELINFVVRPIALPTSDVSAKYSPFPAVTTGFGLISSHSRAEILEWKETGVISRAECVDLKGKNDEVTADTICTKNAPNTGRKLQYNGAALTTRNHPKQLIGILSRSPVASNSPVDYYTNVFSHLNFIRESLKLLN